MIFLLCVTYFTQYDKDLLYSTGYSAQCEMTAWMAGGFGGEWIHAYVWLSHFAVHLKLSQKF